MNHVVILRFLLKGDKTFFDVPSAKQKAFLDTIPTPEDDIDRSFYQFKCQFFFSPRWKRWLLDIASFFLYIPLLIYYIIRGIGIASKTKCDAISDLNSMREVIPQELFDRYQIEFVGNYPKGSLTIKDVPFVFKVLCRHFPAFYLSIKSMVKIAQYRQLIRMYSPQCIIAHHEYSFSSSILTAFCNQNNVKHINVMHGEKLYNIVDAFFHFDECYVWSHHYEQLFIDMRAEPSQFRIALPPSMHINIKANICDKVYADYKYYLGEITEDQFLSVVDSMTFAKRNGKTVKYRLHPRYDNLNLLLQYVSFDEIEDPKSVSIIDSIINCSYVVGTYSTVLNQAYCSGRSVLLDDVTFKDQYDRLADLRYWLIGENCPRLSEMQ